MIPSFPKFIKLSQDHKPHFHPVHQLSIPPSDHVFFNLFNWDTTGITEISILNDNLVFKLKDYVSDEIFYSFVGNKKILETVTQLLHHSKENNLSPFLKLLPSANFKTKDIEKLEIEFNIKEDRDNFDYILNIDDLVKMSGSKFFNKKNKLNQFIKKYESKVRVVSLIDTSIIDEVIQFHLDWVSSKKKKGSDSTNDDELEVFKKLFKHLQLFQTEAVLVYVDRKLVGFSIFEKINHEYALHFLQKGDNNYKGIYEFLYHNMAKHLQEKGIKYLNIEQDLGIEGLRRAKLDYNPTFLKKYIISNKLLD